jgi:hypothetical protein
MKKKKKQSSQPNLSPENYIKTRARSLPIYKCLISDNWEESSLPTIVVSRIHANGNVSACLYTVDLNCLGVVYTDFIFNVEEEVMMKIVDHYFNEMLIDTQYIEIEYPLAHNILYAGMEFAGEWGIPVQKNLYVTREFLEPDDDHIELIEIDCGIKGFPAFNPDLYEDFFNGDPDTIIQKLEKNPGHENYTMIHHYNSDEIPGQDWDDEDDDWENDDSDETFDMDEYPDDEKILIENFGIVEYTHKEFEKDKKYFLKYSGISDSKFKIKDFDKFEKVLDRLGNHLVDGEMVKNYYDLLFDVELHQIVFDSLPDGFITLNSSSPGFEKKVVDVLMDYMADDQRPRKNIKKLEKLIGYQPLTEYLNLSQDKLENINPVSIDHKQQKALMMFPDYSLLKLFHFGQLMESSAGELELPDEVLSLSNYFTGRDEIHIIEFQAYVVLLVNYITPRYYLEKLIAFEDFLFEQILPDDLNAAFGIMLMAAKIVCIKERLKDHQGRLNRV